MAGKEAPGHQRGRGRPCEAPSAHRRPGYPLSGCVPAEPDSVSPGGGTVTSRSERHKCNTPGRVTEARPDRCTTEPGWVRFARRCGSVSRADYQPEGSEEDPRGDGREELVAGLRQQPGEPGQADVRLRRGGGDGPRHRLPSPPGGQGP